MGLLGGKKGIILGVANDHSLAWGSAVTGETIYVDAGLHHIAAAPA